MAKVVATRHRGVYRLEFCDYRGRRCRMKIEASSRREAEEELFEAIGNEVVNAMAFHWGQVASWMLGPRKPIGKPCRRLQGQ